MSTAVTPVAMQRVPTVQWQTEIEGARMLLKSGLLPDTIKSAETALFIILTGRDLGLSPVQSLRSINIIKGKVEVAADMQLGLFHRAGGKSQFVKLTDTEALLRLAAPWLIEPHDERFTMQDAQRARLAGDNWQKYPKAMLRSRAITAGLKSIGFDPTAGVYDYGEISGDEPQLTDTAEAVEAAEVDSGQENEATDEEKAESAALMEIEALLPGLAENQQEWVRAKLRDGAKAIPMVEAVRNRARLVAGDARE